MKQGRATTTGNDPKTEPVSKAASHAGVGQIGLALGVRHDPIDAGRGYKALPIGGGVHPSGSQGKHR